MRTDAAAVSKTVSVWNIKELDKTKQVLLGYNAV
jgi:hypothetical protein